MINNNNVIWKPHLTRYVIKMYNFKYLANINMASILFYIYIENRIYIYIYT